MKQTFGEFLASRRKEKGLTQRALAEMLFVSESAVSKWEQNRSNPDISILPKLSEMLGVTEHELITASIDSVSRENSIKARKWTNLSIAWQLFFAIAYGVTLLTCFIVDLALGKGLSWFWIVLFSLLLAACFTSLPSLIKKNKLLILSLSPLSSLLILLLVCCLYTGGNWFFIALLPIVISFIMVFLPIYISVYPFYSIIKKHSAIFCLLVNTLMTTTMLYVIEHYTVKHEYTDCHWATAVAMPIFLTCAAFAFLLAAIIRYLPVGRWFKAAAALAVTGAFLPLINHTVEAVLHNTLGEPYASYPVNLFSWNEKTVNGNVRALILITVLLTAAAFLIVGFILKKRKWHTSVEKTVQNEKNSNKNQT